jgi:hypothetical protein
LHFGPGRHVNHKDFEHHEAYAADYVSAENETDAQRLLLTPPPAYGDFNLPFDEDFDWDQLQKDIDRECKNAQERADYFCSDKGRQFLKAHYDLIDTAWHINVGERHHVKPSKAGWVTTIPNADLAQRSKAVLKAQNGATPKTGLKGKLQRFAAPQKTAARSLSLSDLKEKLGSATVSDGHSLPTYDQVVLEKEMQRREKVLNRIG